MSLGEPDQPTPWFSLTLDSLARAFNQVELRFFESLQSAQVYVIELKPSWAFKFFIEPFLVFIELCLRLVIVYIIWPIKLEKKPADFAKIQAHIREILILLRGLKQARVIPALEL